MAKLLKGLVEKAVLNTAKKAEEKRLMFLHNTSAEKIARQEKMGGMPMPSVAVTKEDIPFDSFGDITLVGKPEQFHPKSDKANKIYAADAYTARAPSPIRKAVKGAGKKFQAELEGKLKAFGEYTDYLSSNIWELDGGNISPDKYASTERFFKSAESMDAVFLEEKGIKIPKKYSYGIDGERITEFMPDTVSTIGTFFENFLKKSDGNLEKALSDFDENYPNYSKQSKIIKKSLSGKKIEKIDSGSDDYDKDFVRNEVSKIADERSAWGEKKFSEYFGEDEFFISNPQRDHYTQKASLKPYTAENVSKYMKKLGGAGAEGGSVMNSAGGIRSATLKKFKDYGDLKKSQNQLVGTEEINQFKADADQMLEDLEDNARMYFSGDKRSSFYSSEFAEMLRESEKMGTRNALKEFLFEDVPDELVQEINQYKDILRNGLTQYFEAKPERVVQFDEFGGAIVPEKTPKAVIEMLESKGIEVKTYKGEDQRTEARKNFDKYKFETLMGVGIGAGAMAASDDAKAGALTKQAIKQASKVPFEDKIKAVQGKKKISNLADQLKEAAKKANLDPDAIKLLDDGSISYPEEFITPLSDVGAGDIRREIAINNDLILGTDTKAEFETEGYHGSTHNVGDALDGTRANTQSDWGAGTYISDTIDDVNANYAGEGPDLTNRLVIEKERIDQDLQDDPNLRDEILEQNGISLEEFEADPDAVADKIARKILVGDAGGGVVYPLKVNTKNFAEIGGDNPTYLDETEFDIDPNDFDDPDDYQDALRDAVFDDPDSLYNRVYSAMSEAGIDEDGISSVMESIQDEILESGTLNLADLDDAIRKSDIYAYDHADEEITGGAVSANVLRELGFDGVIDNTVNQKFGSERKMGKQMEGMDYDTRHIVTFPRKESVIRSDNAAFDPQFKNSRNLLGQAKPSLMGYLAGGSAAAAAAPLLMSDDASASNIDLRTPKDDAIEREAQSLRLADAASKKKAFLEKRAEKGSQRAIDRLAEIGVGAGEVVKTIGAGMANEVAAGLFGIAASLDPRNEKGAGAEMVKQIQDNPIIESPVETKEGVRQLMGFANLIKETSDYWSSQGEGGEFIDDIQAKNEFTRGLEVVDNFNESADYLGEEVHPALGTGLKILPDLVF